MKELGFWRNVVGTVVNFGKGNWKVAQRSAGRLVSTLWSGVTDLFSSIVNGVEYDEQEYYEYY